MFEQLMPSVPPGKVSVWSGRLAGVPHLSSFLGPGTDTGFMALSKLSAVIAWGVQGASVMARQFAQRRHIPFFAVGNGFFRSLDYKNRSAAPYSLTFDSTGISYDGTRPSDLENLLNSTGWESPELMAEAKEAMQAIIRLNLSKYNQAPDASPYLLTTPGMRTRILILDQTIDDVRVRLGMADADTFIRMLEKARADHPGAALFIKTHPAVLANLKKGYLAHNAAAKGVTLIGQDVSPMSLLSQADEVYVVNSQMGFEALLLGKNVHCFGMPFYAGWGLTQDALTCSRRTKTRNITELFAAACLLYTRYVNPVTGQVCSISEIIRLLAEQRLLNEQNSRTGFCHGFSRGELVTVSNFLFSTRGKTVVEKDQEEAARKAEIGKGKVVAPAARVSLDLRKICARHGVPVIRAQQGIFPNLNSGKGRLFAVPPSLALDSEGLYDDPARISRLESLLEHAVFDPGLKARGSSLGEFMLNNDLLFNSEFANLAARSEYEPSDLANGRKLILIPGQDEDSPAFILGGMGIGSNKVLVEQVRQACPQDFILYLNPPGGKKKLSWQDLPAADAVLDNTSPLKLLDSAHEVHTLSSLVGLDALIRNIPVHTYGGPFYAGWGLTRDRHIFSRRTRPLSLDGLLAGCLILYPTYFDWHTRMFCGPEEICAVYALPGRHKLPLKTRLKRMVVDWRLYMQV